MRALLLFFMLLLLSCGGHRKAAEAEIASEPVEEVDFFVFDLERGIDEGPAATTFNELVDTLSFIPLETHPDALLPMRYRFAKIGEDMFIGGGMVPRSAPIYRFDSLGRFVKQMTWHGRGPGEVTYNMMWHANANLKRIDVVSDGGTIVFVDAESGERSNARYDSSHGFDWVPLNDSTFVSATGLFSTGPHNTYLYFTDSTGEIVHTGERHDAMANYHYRVPEGAWAGPWDDYWLVPDYKGDAILHDIFNDTLYRVKSHREITPHLVLRRGGLAPDPKDAGPENRTRRLRQVYFSHVIESGDHLFLNYQLGGKVWRDIWSKRDGRLLLHWVPGRGGGNFEFFVPFELPDGTIAEMQVHSADRDHVYCTIEALDACKFLPGVKEEDNPVVVVAKL